MKKPIVFISILLLALFFPKASCSANPIDTLQPGEWYEVLNSKIRDVTPTDMYADYQIGRFSSIIYSWNSGAYDTKRDKYIITGGGHNDYGGNELYTFNINTLQWSRAWGPSPNIPVPVSSSCLETYDDGNPRSRHTYDGLEYLPNVDKFWMHGGSLYCTTGGSGQATWTFDFDTLQWFRKSDPIYSSRLEMVSAYDPLTGHMFVAGGNSWQILLEYDPVSDVWTKRGDQPIAGEQTATIDTKRRKFVSIGSGYVFSYDLTPAGTLIRQTLTTTGATEIVSKGYPGIEYDTVSDKIVAWHGGGDVYTLDMDTLVWIKHTTASAQVPSPGLKNGTFNRWRYVPSKNVFIIANSVDENVFVYKLSSDKTPAGEQKINITPGVFYALDYPDKPPTGIQNTKHVTWAHNPVNGRLYSMGGDFSDGSYPPGSFNSYRQDMYSFSVAERWANRSDRNAGWRQEFPYCGPPGSVQPKSPDFVGWTWDSSQNVFWMVPGTMVTPGNETCPGRTVSRNDDPQFKMGHMMTFDPFEPDLAKRWKDWGQSTRNNIAGEDWMSIYDPKTDTIIHFDNNETVSFYDPKTNTWISQRHESNALGGTVRIYAVALSPDFENRVIYAVDETAGRLMRWNMDAKTMSDLGPVPDGVAVLSINSSFSAWDSINKVLYFFHPITSRLHVYHPDTQTWETPTITTDPPGLTPEVNHAIVFDPYQNVLAFLGNRDDAMPYDFIYRYGNGSGVVPKPIVPQYSVYEVALTTTNTYANPYTDVTLSATFQGPTKTIVIDGFWDGGALWKIRMAPTEIGTWTYVTTSSDSKLHGKNGSFEAVVSSDSGFVERDPSNPWGWRTAGNKQSHFWLSDTCWRCFQRLTVAQFKEYIDARSSQGFNHVRGHFNSMDNGVANEGGPPFNSNWDVINPGYWQGVDTRLAYATSKGITMDLTVGSGSRWPAMTSAQRERYLRYLVARYAAYHITWEGLSEYEEYPGGAAALINAIGESIKTYDPYQHPRSTHTLNTNSELVSSVWFDWVMYQSGGPNPSQIIADRSFNKPLINEEYYYEQTCAGASAHNSTPDQMRRGAWQIVISGGYVATGNTATYTGGSNTYNSCGLIGTGVSQMKHLIDFWTKYNIPYWQMIPQNNLATNGARCLVKDNDTYVCYKEAGGSFSLTLTGTIGVFSVKQFNPRDGIFSTLPSVSGGSTATLTLPDAKEWVFLVQKDVRPEDTIPPTITSVSVGSLPTQVSVVFSEPVEQAGATATANYTIDKGIIISVALLGTDLKTATLTTSPHQEGIIYTLTVNNIKDRAATPNTILANSQKTYTYISKLTISNITTTSGRIYQATDNLQNGSLAYIDRTYTYSSISASLLGLTYIKTANDDKASTGAGFLSFSINQDATVYVAYDNRITAKPAWISSFFTDTGDDIATSDTTFSIFMKDFTQGQVSLGGNEGPGGSMYTVIIVPKGLTAIKGDVQCDKAVDILDVQALVNCILGTGSCDWGCGNSADVNKDDSVDVLDVQEVVNVILGG